MNLVRTFCRNDTLETEVIITYSIVKVLVEKNAILFNKVILCLANIHNFVDNHMDKFYF